jgi:transcriptional regulator
MLIRPSDAGIDAAEWQDWLTATDRFGILPVNNSDPARTPCWCPPTSRSPATRYCC